MTATDLRQLADCVLDVAGKIERGEANGEHQNILLRLRPRHYIAAEIQFVVTPNNQPSPRHRRAAKQISTR